MAQNALILNWQHNCTLYINLRLLIWHDLKFKFYKTLKLRYVKFIFFKLISFKFIGQSRFLRF